VIFHWTLVCSAPVTPRDVSTAWAVQATARDAHDRDYQFVVVEDACAAASENEHKTSMELLGQIAKNSNTSRSFT
jgi:nicotinamidase-related amidase